MSKKKKYFDQSFVWKYLREQRWEAYCLELGQDGRKNNLFVREVRNTGEGIRLTGADKNRFRGYT